MKKLTSNGPYIIALIPQFIFTNYIWVLISTVLIGFIASYVVSPVKVFGKMFILEFILFFVLFFMLKERVFYLKDVLLYFQVPSMFLSIVLPIFNALNISILFFAGYKSGRLLQPSPLL